MSLYVDNLIDWGWKYGKSCHLIADTLEELNQFALSIGMRKEWFQQNKNNLPHYDLTEKRRKLAISKGAIEIDKYLFVKMIKEHRAKQQTIEGGENTNGKTKSESSEKEKGASEDAKEKSCKIKERKSATNSRTAFTTYSARSSNVAGNTGFTVTLLQT
jgi:hypothetical protein